MSTIGERIYELRMRRGMTQAELGEKIGESKQTIYKYERGIITNIPLANIEAMAKALRCPPVALTGWEDKAPVKSTPEDPDRDLLNQIYDQLPPVERKRIIAQLKGLMQLYKAQGTDQESD